MENVMIMAASRSGKVQRSSLIIYSLAQGDAFGE